LGGDGSDRIYQSDVEDEVPWDPRPEHVGLKLMRMRRKMTKHDKHTQTYRIFFIDQLSEAFHKAYANKIEVPGVEATSALGGVGVCWVAVLSGPR